MRYLIILFLLSAITSQGQTVQTSPLLQFVYPTISAAEAGINTEAYISVFHENKKIAESISIQSNSLVLGLPWINKAKKYQQGGFQLYYLNESTDNLIGTNRNEIGGSWAYTVRIHKNHDLSMGIGVACSSINMTASGLTTGSLWDPIYGFVPDGQINETELDYKNTYTSINGSLLWSSLDRYSRGKHKIGLNLYHLNKPKGSSYSSIDYLPIGMSISTEVTFWLTTQLSIEPQIIYVFNHQDHSLQSTLWGAFHFYNENPTDPITSGYLKAGFTYQSQGNIGLGFSLEQDKYELGFYNFFSTSDTPLPQSTFQVGLKLKKEIIQRRRKKEIYYKSTATNSAKGNRKYRAFTSSENSLEQTPLDEVPDEKESEPIKYILQYKFNETRLTKNSQMQLDFTVKLLLQNPKLQLKIVGHSDDLGTEKVKAKVAWERAKKIRDYLWSNGVEKMRIQTSAMSDKQPLVDNDNEENKAKNRRVELLIFE